MIAIGPATAVPAAAPNLVAALYPITFVKAANFYRCDGSGASTADAVAYRLNDMGAGLWTLNSSKSMHYAATQGYQVVGWSASAVASQWYITAIETGDTYELQELANRRHTETTSISSAYLSADEAAASDDAVIYNLYGQRLSRITAPGIYIINGKKTYVK